MTNETGDKTEGAVNSMTDAQNETLRERVAKAVEAAIVSGCEKVNAVPRALLTLVGGITDAAIAAVQPWTEDDSDFVAKAIKSEFELLRVGEILIMVDLSDLSGAITHAVAALGGRAPVSGWRPIGEAGEVKKSQAQVDLWVSQPDGEPYRWPDCCFADGEWYGRDSLGSFVDVENEANVVTHFMPIPAPPVTK